MSLDATIPTIDSLPTDRPAAASSGMAAADRRRHRARGTFDRWLLLAISALVVIGAVMVASSSIPVAVHEGLAPFHYLRRHLVFLLAGGMLMAFLSRLELRWVEKHRIVWLLASIGLLAAVFLPGIGLRVNGSQRWLDLGISTFQPMEVAKVAVIIYVASYMVRHRDSLEQKFFGALNPLLVALLFAGLLLAQPDFGSAVLLVTVAVAMVWLGGARLRYLMGMAAAVLPLAAVVAMSESYRMERLTSFLNPWQDPFAGAFQLTQSLIAIGRGHWFGVGLGNSVQKLFYLPEAHTDFILAVIAEELGLFGVLVILGLFALLVSRGLLLGLRGVHAGQHFAAFVAFGVVLSIGLQALISIGVNLGALPTKGLTLPLVSSGGSSVVMTCVMLGLLLRASYEITRAERQRKFRDRGAVAPAEVGDA